MPYFIFFICFIFSSSVFALNLEKYDVELSYPWGMTWVDSTNLLITQKKSKEIVLVDTKNNTSIIENTIIGIIVPKKTKRTPRPKPIAKPPNITYRFLFSFTC